MGHKTLLYIRTRRCGTVWDGVGRCGKNKFALEIWGLKSIHARESFYEPKRKSAMYFNNIQHVVTTVPAPPLFIEKNRQSSEMLVGEVQRIINNINMGMTPAVMRFAFDTKYYVNCDTYSDIFSEELRKVISHFYAFHHYEVFWDGDLVQISWAPVSSREFTKGCNAHYVEKSSDNDADSDTESPRAKKVMKIRGRSRRNNLA